MKAEQVAEYQSEPGQVKKLVGLNIAYFLEGFVYFSMLGYLAIYFMDSIGLAEVESFKYVSYLAGGVSLAGATAGWVSDRVGLKWAILASLLLLFFGRSLLSFAPSANLEGSLKIAKFGLGAIILGYGIWQPACYSAVYRFAKPHNRAFAFAILYAAMNFGGGITGVSALLRRNLGLPGAFWVYTGLTVVALIVILVFWGSTKTSRPVADPSTRHLEQDAWRVHWFPLLNARFMFLCVALVPVQMLFAHNWLTVPVYMERSMDASVINIFYTLVDWNPWIVAFLAPIIALITRRKNPYSIIIIGSLIMALSTVFLMLGPSPTPMQFYIYWQ